jgi:ABC-2 type transport system permease protein
VLVGYVQISVVLLVGRLIFRVPITGSLLLFYLVTLAFIVATLSVGLVVSPVQTNPILGSYGWETDSLF